MAYVLFATKNVPLDPSYKDVIRFEVSTIPTTAQDTIPEVRDAFMTTYFRNYADTSSIYKSYANYNEVNFDYGDGINTVLNYDLSKLLATPQSQYDQVMNLALNSNYLHFRPTAAAGTNTDRFYFIRSARQLNANVVQFVLELDIFSTYPQMSMTGGIFLNRNHQDRFVNKGGTTYAFRTDNATLTGDILDSKYNATIPSTNRDQPKLEYFVPTAESQAVLDAINNLNGWAYFWFSAHPQDNNLSWKSRVTIQDGNPANFAAYVTNNLDAEGYNYGLYCAAVPLKNCQLNWNNGAIDVTSEWSFTRMYEYYYGDGQLVSITISPFAPFVTQSAGGNIWSKFQLVTLDLQFNARTPAPDGVSVIGSNRFLYWNNVPEGYFFASQTAQLDLAFWMVRFDLKGEYIESQPITNNLTYLTSVPAYNLARQITYEPKLFTTPYNKWSLQSIYTDKMEFSRLAFDANRIKIISQELPNPTQQKLSMTLERDTSSQYTGTSFYDRYDNNNLWLKQINSYTMPIGFDPWKSFIDNRLVQTIATVGVAAAGVGIGVATGGLGLAALAGAGGLVSAGASILQSAVTPTSQKAGGNDLVADYGILGNLYPFVVELELLPHDKQRVLDYFFNYGYQVDQVRTFDTNATTGMLLRTRFNYVKAEDLSLVDRVFQTGATMSKPIRERIQKAFNDGITFWNYYGLSTDSTKGQAISFINSNIFDRTTYENLEKIFAYT